MKRALFLALLAASLTIQAQTTYYVSTTGNDATGNGSLSSPWKTLNKACSSVTTAGSIIHVNAGTYLETTRSTLSPGVSIEGEGNSTVITNTSLTSRINYGPNGSNGDAILNLVSSSVVNGNQEIRSIKFDGANLTCSHAIYIMNRHNVKIHDCTFQNFNYSAVAWWASGTGDGIAPSTRLRGSEFYNNSVTNCAGYNSGDASFYGALYCGGHEGMLIHDNVMIENGHSKSNQGWPIKFWLWGGMMNGCKIYNNHLEKTDFSVWDFAIESTGEDGMEIYNNTIIGGIDLNKQNYSGAYEYSVYIHDNQIGPSNQISALSVAGITLEHNNKKVIVERNTIQNCSPAILFTPRATAQEEVTIRYNVMKNIRTSSYYTEGITILPSGTGTTISGFYVYNNVIQGTSGSTDYGIRFVHSGGSAIASADNVQIINNIIMNFNGYNGSPVYLTGASVYSNLYIQNNVFYNNGNSNEPLFSGTPISYFKTTPIKTNPLFISAGTDFHLQSGSPAIDAGKDLGLTTDFELNSVPSNAAPDIGAYEYGGVAGVPVYLSSVVENSTPSVLELTYSMSLANIVPATSAFAVMVNSAARSVSAVSVSGTKVSLTLSSPVVYGDVVTVAYTKPATNPLQTSSGGEAASFTAKPVTNNVASSVPVYISSVIQNATPSLLEMTYSLTLASIVPATSAFTVMVNSAARSVSAVSVSGTKVSLTLSSPVVYGDVVTVAYTKPSTNPLQTSSGSQAVSITAKAVTNNVAAASIPLYVSSVIQNATPSVLEMTYSLALANIVPATSAFTVRVNSAVRSISSVSVSGTKVSLTLSSPVVYGDAVTVAYTKPSTNPLQTSSGGQAASITAKAVTNNVAASIPVYVSSVIQNATPSVLEMTYNMTLANIVPPTSAFTVRVNSAVRPESSISISGTKVLVTLSSPVAYGDVITVTYYKATTNPLQTPAGALAESISNQPVINNVSTSPNQPPTVSISSPTKNSSFIAPANITIDAAASDPDGTIGKVEFYNGSTKLGERTSSPYSFIWKEVPEGTYALTAVATDNLNAKTVSDQVYITVTKSTPAVNQLPIVSIHAKKKSKYYKKHDNVVIIASAEDPDGTISKVVLKSGDVTIAEMIEPPYIYTMIDVDTGTYVITAIATDNLGATSVSESLELFVENYWPNSEMIDIYPNPNDGHFTVDIHSGLPDQNNRIRIVSTSGRSVHDEIIDGYENYKEFDLSGKIDPGIYVIMLTNGRKILSTKKFIKR